MSYELKNSKPESAIALPFAIDAFGSVNKSTDQSKIWADRVLSVIGTWSGERLFRPTFGSQVSKSLLSNVSTATEDVQKEISIAFANSLPRLQLSAIEVTIDSPETVTVSVAYSLPDNNESQTTVGLVAISGNLPPSEERA